jgi:hypothetical protein
MENIHERRAMTSVVTCHGGIDGADKAGSTFLDWELLFPLDQIFQSHDSWKRCQIVENDAPCSMGCAIKNIHQTRDGGVPSKTFIRREM